MKGKSGQQTRLREKPEKPVTLAFQVAEIHG
ncbi:hypothetical protein N478_22675 [Pseudoalteromonas luteoviolacea S4060-1]|uniref:Uncharacterized protein n=1 Tax=Pseudoalteromonas luteoviolacea S4060-1 TaxID=1365257 RepID=A0A167L8M2_9GAMM|nr:hypothetical protein N478_22675 [Pseudoalteromonas luteoviolacea S4060-1]